MKLFILLIAFVLVFVEVQSTILQELLKTDQQCRQESQIGEQDLKSLLSFKATQPVKCYLKCVLQSEGVFENSKIDKKAVLDILGKFKYLRKLEGFVSKVLDQCENVKADNECDAAFAAVKCVVINAIKVVGGILGDPLFSE